MYIICGGLQNALVIYKFMLTDISLAKTFFREKRVILITFAVFYVST